MSPVPAWQSIGRLVLVLLVLYATARCLRPRSSCREHITDRALYSTAGACALLFAALTIALLTADWVEAIDQGIRAWVSVLHDDAFVRLCAFITAMANVETIVAVTIVAAGLLWTQRRHHDVAGLAVSVLGSQIITYAAKYAIARDRPEFEAFAQAVTPSYPSAHASSAVAVYGFIVLAVIRPLPNSRLRFEITFWGTAFILLIAASRIALGVHFASDVVAGLLVGLFWLAAGTLTSRRRT